MATSHVKVTRPPCLFIHEENYAILLMPCLLTTITVSITTPLETLRLQLTGSYDSNTTMRGFEL